jgi:hypothetical protein
MQVLAIIVLAVLLAYFVHPLCLLLLLLLILFL